LAFFSQLFFRVKSTDGAITQACRNGQPQASYSFKMMEAIANCSNLKPPDNSIAKELATRTKETIALIISVSIQFSDLYDKQTQTSH
jgi:hypothetical protein